MNTEKEIKQIDNVIAQLKLLKSSLLKTEKASEKSFNTSPSTHTPSQCSKAVTALNMECMQLDRCRRKVWTAIKEAEELEVSLEEPDEYHISGYHKWKNK